MAEDRKNVIELLKKGATLEQISEKLGMPMQRLYGLVESLAGEGIVEVKRSESSRFEITDEGLGYLKGFPEEFVAREVGEKKAVEVGKIRNNIGLIWAKRNGWIRIEGGKALPGKPVGNGYRQRAALQSIHSGEDYGKVLKEYGKEVEALVSRGLVKVIKEKHISSVELTDTTKSEGAFDSGIGELTREMIKNQDISSFNFKPYYIDKGIRRQRSARLHPMHKMIRAIRERWVGMGFKETYGPIVESSFWNFDVLFSPQDHPTREMQDTFFLSNPKYLDIDDIKILGRVRRMHNSAWKEKWSEELARRAVLRTHATSVSAHNISAYSSFDSDYPIKLFSIGKIFRNEAIDYKHLAELHQVDGIVIGNSLTLANLFDILKNFYSSFGIDVKFKPSYFPFTEPSVEMYYYDEKFKDNIELGGGGIIRKEITKSLGTNKSVLAWGLGIERLLFNYINIGSLTDLYENNIGKLSEMEEVVI
ncbi:MAG: phenylalanine--tRNA ligase subunit alpha [Candidatus Micrarchaeaceae archaeon]